MSPLARSWILIIQRLDGRRVTATAIALLIGLLITQTLVAARRTTASLGQTAPVVVAEVDLAPGQPIAASDLRVEHHPVGLLPPNALDNPDHAVGATVRSAIPAGEPISLRRIGPGRFGLDRHQRAVTLPMPLAPPPVEVGDGVEVVGVGLIPGTEVVEARLLGPGKVVHRDDQGITVAMSARLSIIVLEWLAAGAVDVMVTPNEAE